VVGYFGFTSIPEHGRTPKAYSLTRRGFDWLLNESTLSIEEVGPFHDVHREFSWTSQMYHRLRLLDCFISLEVAVSARPHLVLTRTFLEYRRIKGTSARETTDYVVDAQTPENRIVPAGAFILENREKGRMGLFFIEMDMGTERVIAPTSRDQRATIRGKFVSYDRYLSSGRSVKTYERYCDFGFFVLLFVALSAERVENIRAAVSDLQPNLHQYYNLTTLEEAERDFLGPVWKNRDQKDTVLHALVADA